MSEFIVNNYIYIHGENINNAKKTRRKLKKININIDSFDIKNYSDNLTKTIYNDIKLKLKYKKNIEYLGVITDNNVIIHNITRLPPQPKTWDILCCEADVSLHRYTSDLNNVYWCNTEINDSRHMILNLNSKNVLNSLKKMSKWDDFIKEINKTCKIFTITQHALSERVEKYIEHKQIRVKDSKIKSEKINEYNKLCKDELLKVQKNINKLSIDQINLLSRDFDKYTNDLNYEENYNLLPSVSIICIPTTSDLFFHLLHSFLKLDYPIDKLQLIIIDTSDLEKKIKRYLPEDSRIKLINISQKTDKNKYTDIPLGYKLNIGCKYAENDLIFHMFDTNHYIISNFKTVIKTFIKLNKNDMLISYDTAYYINEKSYINDICSIKNMLYTKKFWEVTIFEETCNDEYVLLYKFLKNKISLVTSIPFIYFSFDYISNNYNGDGKVIDFNLEKLLDENTKTSYKAFTN